MRLAAAALAFLLAGCASAPSIPTPTTPTPPSTPGWSAPSAVDPAAFAGEPDAAFLPSGAVVVCGIPKGSDATVAAWALAPRATAFARLPPLATPGIVDCSWGVDDAGRAYLATSAGGAISVAVTTDARAWAAQTRVGPGAYDRPFVAGGAAGRAVLVADDLSRAAWVAFATQDGGASWSGPVDVTPPSPSTFETGGHLVWAGNTSFGFPIGALSEEGTALELRHVDFARSDDGGRTWRLVPVAAHLDGNAALAYPTASALGPRVAVAWSQANADGKGARLFATESSDAGATWAAPSAHTPDGTTSLLPRALETPEGLRLACYQADKAVAWTSEPASWRVVVDGVDVSAGAVHNGTVSTGGYGTVPREALRGPTTSNSGNLGEQLALARAPDGRMLAAWTTDLDGRDHLAWAAFP